jgi:hypothetical protein
MFSNCIDVQCLLKVLVESFGIEHLELAWMLQFENIFGKVSDGLLDVFLVLI